MRVSRRSVLGSTLALAAVQAGSPLRSLAQDATPRTGAAGNPGVAIARVRALSTPDLAQAIYPDVMTRFLPPTREVAGYRGYVFAFDDDDPAAQLTITLLDDDDAAKDAGAVAQEYVGGLDPRLSPETPFAQQGAIRAYQRTDRAADDAPPFLHGCKVTTRRRVNAPDADIDALVTLVTNDLIPLLAAMDGFVLYAWIEVEGGRLAMNVWETAEQLAAGDQAVADFVAQNTAPSAIGDPEVYTGTIAYTDILSAG